MADVTGNEGTTPPAHRVTLVPKLNVGVAFGVTVTVNVTGMAHTLPVGVNVYTPEDWLLTVDGLHVPAILLSDVAGSAGTAAPSHMVKALPKLNVGVMLGVTVTLKVAVVAHCPAAGVNV